MGFAISWIAVQHTEPQQILTQLRLIRTGQYEEIPEAPLSSAALPNGWFLIYSNEFNSPLSSEKSLQTLSSNGSVLSCQVEEHVMFSSAAYYTNGTLVWQVMHDAQKGIYNITKKGHLPKEFEAIYAALKQKQDKAGGEKANVDYMMDVPTELAKTITSFKHDQMFPSNNKEPFEVLSLSLKPWWKLW